MFLLLLVIDFSDQYKIIHCKSTNENSVCYKWHHTYHNSLENFSQFIDKFTKTFYSEFIYSYKVRIKIKKKYKWYLVRKHLWTDLSIQFLLSKHKLKINQIIKKDDGKIFYYLKIEKITKNMQKAINVRGYYFENEKT